MAFLLARIAEDMDLAWVSCSGAQWRYRLWDGLDQVIDMENNEIVCVAELDMDAMHIANWDPARVLAGCEMKKQIITACVEARDPAVREFADWGVLRLLVQPYAEHPDFRAEWRL